MYLPYRISTLNQMDINLLYIKVLTITLLIKSIHASTQTQIYPLFSPSDAVNPRPIKDLNKLITIKPALLRASSLTSLLKKPNLNLFNKPPSIAFLKVKNKRYLPPSFDFLFSGGSNKNNLIPTYQLASPITSSLIGTSIVSLDPITTNLKSTDSKKVQQFITKPLFVPIRPNPLPSGNGRGRGGMKKQNTWNNLLPLSNFNNQLPIKTSLPVFVFSDSKSNFSPNKNQHHRQQPTNKPNNSNGNLPSGLQSNQYNNNNNNVNQTMKATNYKPATSPLQTPAYMHDFRPIVSSNTNGMRSGRTMTTFDNKSQYRPLNEVKTGEQINYFNSNSKLLPNNLDLERNILNTIEKDIEIKNLKFIKSIILPSSSPPKKMESQLRQHNFVDNHPDQKIRKQKSLNHANVNSINDKPGQMATQHNQITNRSPPVQQQNHYSHHQQVQHRHYNNNPPHSATGDSKNFNNSPIQQPIQQQYVQHFLKTPQQQSQNNQYDRMPDKPAMGNDYKDNRPEQSNQIKMHKFKLIQYADKNAIEEFTKALENIDFKSITDSDLEGLNDFVYNKLNDAKLETMTGHREDSNGQESYNQQQQQQQQSQNNYRANNDMQDNQPNKPTNQPPLEYFTANDNCAKNRRLKQQQQNVQLNNRSNQQPNYSSSQQSMNNKAPQYSNYQQQQGSSSQQKSSFYNDQLAKSINSLVKFDDQANFYSTASTKLKQLKVLPSTGELSTSNEDHHHHHQFNGDRTNEPINEMNSQSNGQQQPNAQSITQPIQSSNRLNIKNNEFDEWTKKEINDDEIDHKKTHSDIESGMDHQSDRVDNKKIMNASSTETDSLDPTKLDLKIIHLPVSVFKRLVQAEQNKKKK